MKTLIVDDNPKDTERLGGWLTDHKLQVAICASGAEALKLMEAEGNSFQMAFVLWNVKGMPNGLELLARFRQGFPKLQTVVMSHDLPPEVVTVASKLGARRFLLKPLHAERVLDCLQTMRARVRETASETINVLRQRLAGASQILTQTLRDIERAINNPSRGVLVVGETGTGKELIAQAIHDCGMPKGAPLVSVSLSTIPSELVADALFGHERNAFFGATTARTGFLEEAEDGTLFLDEVGELPAKVQADLLRALQTRRFYRLGATKETTFNARIICATNVDLAVAINEGRFRRDLYFRLAQLTINVPPLRDRHGDVLILAYHFLDQYSQERHFTLSRETLSFLSNYHYSGNIRELETMITVALSKCDDHKIRPDHFDLEEIAKLLSIQPVKTVSLPLAPIFPEEWFTLPLYEAEAKAIDALDLAYLTRLQKEHRNNKSRMAQAANVDRKILYQRMERAGLLEMDILPGEKE